MVVELLYEVSCPHQRDARCRKPLFTTWVRKNSCVKQELAFQFLGDFGRWSKSRLVLDYGHRGVD